MLDGTIAALLDTLAWRFTPFITVIQVAIRVALSITLILQCVTVLPLGSLREPTSRRPAWSLSRLKYTAPASPLHYNYLAGFVSFARCTLEGSSRRSDMDPAFLEYLKHERLIVDVSPFLRNHPSTESLTWIATVRIWFAFLVFFGHISDC